MISLAALLSILLLHMPVGNVGGAAPGTTVVPMDVWGPGPSLTASGG